VESNPKNPEPETRNPLSESLAWLDYCLSETAAAMAAVREAALEKMRINGMMPPLPYHQFCEAEAGIITLRGRAAKWGAAGGENSG
jgi:hypothetical protein